jgi:hypothetical protein
MLMSLIAWIFCLCLFDGFEMLYMYIWPTFEPISYNHLGDPHFLTKEVKPFSENTYSMPRYLIVFVIKLKIFQLVISTLFPGWLDWS